jgi:hypothetical protein
MEPAVRSIQVASALTDRLAALLSHRQTSVKLHRFNNESLAADELSLRLGEAQQISPEIWSHLDAARRELVARGIDVSAYDRIRAAQDPALLAASNVDVKHHLSLEGGLHVATTKSVTWSADNFTGAIDACNALKAALPDIDWTALDRADEQQIAAAGTMKSVSSKKLLALVLAIVILAGAAVATVFVVRARKAGDPTTNEPQLRFGAEIKQATDAYRKNACDRDAGAKLVSCLVADGFPRRALEIIERQKRCDREP